MWIGDLLCRPKVKSFCLLFLSGAVNLEHSDICDINFLTRVLLFFFFVFMVLLFAPPPTLSFRQKSLHVYFQNLSFLYPQQLLRGTFFDILVCSQFE